MPEIIQDKKVFTLREVTLSIQRTLAGRYPTPFWVRAEMNKLNLYSHSGHCYPELVEKAEGKIVAQIKAVMWKSDFMRINAAFLRLVGEPLRDGITIMFSATVSFDPVYGLSLRIIEIDPGYTLGLLQIEKQQTLERLTREGIIHRNREAKLALLPKRIAVISVETSKGYADFTQIISRNRWGYRFFHMLFPAILQGDKAAESIILQMKRIRKAIRHFDVVTIIRGGGGDVGLSSFNSYDLAREIVLFPIPVITGIGHSTNETVAEMVAYKNAITPTELADFLIQRFHNFSVPMERAAERMAGSALRVLASGKNELYHTARYLRSVIQRQIIRHAGAIRSLSGSMIQSTRFRLRKETSLLQSIPEDLTKTASSLADREQLSLRSITAGLLREARLVTERTGMKLFIAEKLIHAMDPAAILKRGFSITLHQGKAIRDINALAKGEELTTLTLQGRITSTVESIKTDDEDKT
ncbi:MAG: exodeoxyribonuclease VII large subunit [Bacteroidales bacterium]|nr:exodeoxyribonuclease VII large subunit [Bacteroidales bacterium]